jgi:hypothetical protein
MLLQDGQPRGDEVQVLEQHPLAALRSARHEGERGARLPRPQRHPGEHHRRRGGLLQLLQLRRR